MAETVGAKKPSVNYDAAPFIQNKLECDDPPASLTSLKMPSRVFTNQSGFTP